MQRGSIDPLHAPRCVDLRVVSVTFLSDVFILACGLKAGLAGLLQMNTSFANASIVPLKAKMRRPLCRIHDLCVLGHHFMITDSCSGDCCLARLTVNVL